MKTILTPQDFLTAFAAQNGDTTPLLKQLEKWALDRPDWLLEIGMALLEQSQGAAARQLFGQLLQTLCWSAGDAQRRHSVALLARCDQATWRREGLSRLASRQDAFALVSTVLEVEDEELLLLAINEVVARGSDLRAHPDGARLAQAQTGGPYCYLSLYPLPEEAQYAFPFYGPQVEASSVSFGFPERGFLAIDRAALPNLGLEVRTVEAICLPVRHWAEESNGVLYGAVGSLQRRAAPEAWLPQLPPFHDCQGIVLAPLSAAQCLCKLFNAASGSSAYGQGMRGGLGRLHAWKGLAALLQLPVNQPIERTAEYLRQATWWEFGTDTWFYNEWLDLGLAACWTDEQGTVQFGVLAATDVD